VAVADPTRVGQFSEVSREVATATLGPGRYHPWHSARLCIVRRSCQST